MKDGLPQVDKKTGIHTDKKGVRRTTVNNAVKLINVSPQTIKKFINKNNITSIKGKNANGQLVKLFNLDEMEKQFIELNSYVQVEKQTGIYTDKKDVRWTTVKNAAKIINVSPQTIKKFIEDNNIASIKGRGASEILVKLFNLEELQKQFSGFNSYVRVEKQTRIFTDKKGVRWTTFTNAAKIINVSPQIIKKFIEDNNITSIKGKDASGRLVKLFNLDEMEKQFIEFNSYVQVEKQTRIYTDKKGARWTTVINAAKLINVSPQIIKKFIEDNNITSIKGKNANVQLVDLYNLDGLTQYYDSFPESNSEFADPVTFLEIFNKVKAEA